MAWTNTKRANRKAENRRSHHEAVMEAARTPSQRFWAACGWLASEALKTGRADDATDWILTKVHDIREGSTAHDDRDSYAA